MILKILHKLSWKCFAHIKSLFRLFSDLFCCDCVICLCLINIIQDIKGRAFLFRFLYFLKSFTVEVVCWTDKGVSNFFLQILFQYTSRYSTVFRVHTFHWLEFNHVEVTFTPFVDFICDEMFLNLGYCQCWHSQ